MSEIKPRVRVRPSNNQAKAASYASKAGFPQNARAESSELKTHVMAAPEQFISSYPDEEKVISVLRGNSFLTRTRSPGYLAWLQTNEGLSEGRLGTVPIHVTEALAGPEWDQSCETSTRIWKAAVKLAHQEMMEEGVVLSPLVIALHKEVENLQRDWMETGGTEKLPVPRELAEIRERITNWIKEGAKPRELGLDIEREMMHNSWAAGSAWITEMFLQHTPRAATTAGIYSITHLFLESKLQALMMNTNLTRESAEALLTWAAGNVTNPAIPPENFSIFVELQKRGIVPSADAARILRMHAMTQSGSMTEGLTFISAVTSDKECRKRLLKINGKREGLLLSTQGKAWLEVLADCVSAAGEEVVWLDWPSSAMAQVSEWNLEGVTRKDLLPFMEAPSTEARNQILALMLRLKQRDDSERRRTPARRATL